MAMTIEELEIIRYALKPDVYTYRHLAEVDDALDIVTREINQMKQDQLLSESKANPT